MEADLSLLEAAVEKLGLQDAKGVGAPGARFEGLNGGTDIRARRMGPVDVEDPDAEWLGFDNTCS